MKIAIVTPVFLPYRSGMSQVAAQEAAGLAARGHAVTVFTPDYKQRLKDAASDVIPAQAGIQLVRIKPFFKWGNAAWLPQLGRELKDFDVVRLHYPFFGGVGAVLRAKRPLAVTYHMDAVGRGLKGLIFKVYAKLFLRRLIRRAKKVIVSTLDYAKSSALAPFLDREPEKFVEIMFGVDTELFAPSPPPLSLKGRGGVLFVAALDRAHYFKGLDLLLEAFSRLGGLSLNCHSRPRFREGKLQRKSTTPSSGSRIECGMTDNPRLIVVGDGDLRPRYEEQARRLGIDGQVTFAGAVSDEELVKYYQQAVALAVPSLDRSEAFSLSALQALSCGVPVVASNLPGLRQVVGERGILFPPGDAAALADALRKLLTDANLREALSQSARRFAVNQASAKQEIDKLELLLI